MRVTPMNDASHRDQQSSELPTGQAPRRDKPWIFRTYAGHSTAADSNELYRKNLSKGQTGLSVAFDLPTQTGYDSDHVLARGEVGKVGVPINHLGDMRALFDGIPLAKMNTSMTINATAAWLMALYIAVADEQSVPREALQGTIQNDIIKEYLSRGTYVFPPAPSMRLIKDIAIFTTSELPKWNPMNICSYHLQEAGAKMLQKQRKISGAPDHINVKLQQAERALLIPEGLPNRPWFRHSIYAPGQYTGYAAVVIPGVNEAIDRADLRRTEQQIAVLAAALNRAVLVLEQNR